MNHVEPSAAVPRASVTTGQVSLDGPAGEQGSTAVLSSTRRPVTETEQKTRGIYVPRRPLDDMERRGLAALFRCRFAPATPPKKFVRQMQHATQVTDRQAAWIRRLCWMYRRQIPDAELVEWGRTAEPGRFPQPQTAL